MPPREAGSNTILLLPLDERPVNTRYPEMLARIAGWSVLLPPEEIRGHGRSSADLDAVAQWLRATAEAASCVVASCDYLAFGNLINARISQDSAHAAAARLGLLAEINVRCPVHAFSVITRVANANDCVEEPLYWAEWGTRFYRWAHLFHRSEVSDLPANDAAELSSLTAELPADLRSDWLNRRLRNHAVNLSLLDMASRGELTSLALTSDDTAPYGLSSRERSWLIGWGRLIGEPLSTRVQAYPGADEVGSALVARVINEATGQTPRVYVDYAIDADRTVVARYEDRAIEQTVLGQIRACGCAVVDDVSAADFVLAVVTPNPAQDDYRPEFLARDAAVRTQPYEAFIARLAGRQTIGKPVAIADVAYPNGGDPLFTRLLLSPKSGVLARDLAAYGAWNTAGNTLGVVVAQASLALKAETPEQRDAQRIFLAHRFLEDCGYQSVVRKEARDECERLWGKREPDPDCITNQHEIALFIEGRLMELLAELRRSGIGREVDIAPASTRLPWRRTFEVDFELTAR
ncbi:MAG: DUF4127 family protein [Capsulimonadaceae bacterium]|nr:DUF4127 family protein [Capsulimonadaceae bacterium]